MTKRVAQLLTTISGWLSHNEAAFLEKAVKQTKELEGEIVEIGSFCGKSTICLAQSSGTVYAIDPHKGNVEENLSFKPTYKTFLANIKAAKVEHKVKPMVTTSAQAAKKWKKWNKKIRVLFIDGLHDEKNAMQDFDLWSQHVVDGGIIAIHDSYRNWCGSEKSALRNIVHSPYFGIVGYTDTLIYGIKGKPTGKQRFTKLRMRLYIQTMITIDHIKKALLNLPEIAEKILTKARDDTQFAT